MLNSLAYNQENTLNMNFPSCYESSGPITVYMLIHNVSRVPTVLEISQIKTCKCKPVKTEISMSFSKMILFCPHKDQAQFEPAFCEIEAS